MAIKISISGLGDLSRKMTKWVGKAKTDEVMGQALKAGSEVFGREIKRSYDSYSGVTKYLHKSRTGWKHTRDAVKIAARGRMTKNGPVYFSAVNRKPREGAPQARWLHRGRKVQRARPEVFNSAIARARTAARNATQNALWKAVSEMFDRI